MLLGLAIMARGFLHVYCGKAQLCYCGKATCVPCLLKLNLHVVRLACCGGRLAQSHYHGEDICVPVCGGPQCLTLGLSELSEI